MRYILTVDFEDDIDIESFMHFVAYHTKRLKCASKDVFIRLAHEWEKQLVNPHEPTNPNGVKKEKKKTLKDIYEKYKDKGYTWWCADLPPEFSNQDGTWTGYRLDGDKTHTASTLKRYG